MSLIFPDDIRDFETAKSYFQGLGYKETNFAFSLGRVSGGADIQKDEDRLFLYRSDEADKRSFRLLEEHNLPRLSLAYLGNVDLFSGDTLAIARLPLGARALDSMSFSHQQPSTEFLGSFEILVAISKYLADLFVKTAYLPQKLTLNKLALVSTENNNGNNIIRLIPPLHLEPAQDWRKTLEDLKQDLQLQDPIYNHVKQMQSCERHFQMFLDLATKHD